MKTLGLNPGPTDEKQSSMSCKTTPSWSIPARITRRWAGVCGLTAALALNACAIVEPPSAPGETAAVPADAIAVTPELYMLPMGTDASGCAVFQPWSPTLAVVQALHWRTPAGDFTLDRDEADCRPL